MDDLISISLRFATINILYNPIGIVRGYEFFIEFIIMVIICLLLYNRGIAT